MNPRHKNNDHAHLTVSPQWLRVALSSLLMALATWTSLAQAESLRHVVEVEEDVYSYEPANNGAGPLWCFGSTCLVRTPNGLFASGLETLRDAKPLNNQLNTDENQQREHHNIDGWIFLNKSGNFFNK